MKKLLGINHLTTIVVACLFIFVSCEKGKDETPPVVVKTTEQLLTEKTWKADEIRLQASSGALSYYKRGVSGNTYDSDSIKFNPGNAGIYYFSGVSSPTTWNFTDAAKTRMTIVINQAPSPITIYLENIQVTDAYFKYAQYFTGPGTTYVGSCTRVPN